MEYELTRRVLAALNAHGVAYKVFGAVARNLHGLARATQDLDIFVAPDAANIERLRRTKDRADAEALARRFKLEDK